MDKYAKRAEQEGTSVRSIARIGCIIVLAIITFAGGMFIGSALFQDGSAARRGGMAWVKSNLRLNSDRSGSDGTNANVPPAAYQNPKETLPQSSDPVLLDQVPPTGTQPQQQVPQTSTQQPAHDPLSSIPTAADITADLSRGPFASKIFDGATYLSLPQPLDAPSLTFGAWIFLSSKDTGSRMKTIAANKRPGCSSDAANNGFSLSVNEFGTNNRELRLEWGDEFSGCHSLSTSPGAIPYDQWTHVGFIFSSSPGSSAGKVSYVAMSSPASTYDSLYRHSSWSMAV